MVVYLNGPGRAAVGVAVKPPDESFRRFETARPNPPLYLSLCVLYAALILGEGRPTCTTNRLTARDTSLRTQTIHYPRRGVVWATKAPCSLLQSSASTLSCLPCVLHVPFVIVRTNHNTWVQLCITSKDNCGLSPHLQPGFSLKPHSIANE